MKNNDEYLSSIYSKRDTRLREIKKRKRAVAIIIPAVAVCIAVATLPPRLFAVKSNDAAAQESFDQYNYSYSVNENGIVSDVSDELTSVKANAETESTVPCAESTSAAKGTPTVTQELRFNSVAQLKKHLDGEQQAVKSAVGSICIPVLDGKTRKIDNITLYEFSGQYSVTVIYNLSDGCEYCFSSINAGEDEAINDIYRSTEPVFSGKINGADITLWQTENAGYYSGTAVVNTTHLRITVNGTEPEHLAEEIERFEYIKIAGLLE